MAQRFEAFGRYKKAIRRFLAEAFGYILIEIIGWITKFFLVIVLKRLAYLGSLEVLLALQS